jgi:L-lactate dehydrogenase
MAGGMIQSRSVAVVGAGSVGVAAASTMLVQKTASEILLVDKDASRAEGHAMDLMHGQALVGRADVRAASFADLAAAQVVVIAAGRNQKKGESRLDLLRGNAEIVTSIVEELDRHAPEAIVLVATNPVDILTRVAVKRSRRPAARIIGTGTTLDSARFRALIGAELGVSPRSIHAYVLGEHGDSQVPIWSQASFGGVKVDLDGTQRTRIADATRTAAREIIARKGYTDLAIGIVIAHLVRAILADERGVHPLTVPLEGQLDLRNVCMSMPCILGREGIMRVLEPKLDAEEVAALRTSAGVLQRAERAAGLA